jgi:hypothetical protein
MHGFAAGGGAYCKLCTGVSERSVVPERSFGKECDIFARTSGITAPRGIPSDEMAKARYIQCASRHANTGSKELCSIRENVVSTYARCHVACPAPDRWACSTPWNRLPQSPRSGTRPRVGWASPPALAGILPARRQSEASSLPGTRAPSPPCPSSSLRIAVGSCRRDAGPWRAKRPPYPGPGAAARLTLSQKMRQAKAPAPAMSAVVIANELRPLLSERFSRRAGAMSSAPGWL